MSMDLLQSLVQDHYEFVYRLAYRLSGQASDAEDLTQETFCTVQSKLGQLREPEKARGWLAMIVRRHYALRVRKDASRSLNLVGEFDTLVGESGGDIPDSFDPERLQQALDELAEPYRSAVILFYFEELSYREIAEQLEIAPGTVMSRLARAKRLLRSRLLSPQLTTPIEDLP